METIAKTLTNLTHQLYGYLNNRVNAGQEASWILCHVLSCSTSHLHTHGSAALTAKQQAMVADLASKRINEHTPLAYLLGTTQFCDLNLAVRPPILIPRPETEEMVSWLLETIHHHVGKAPLRILDICTGSGCIALALAHHLPNATVTGLDICNQALELAQENKERCQLKNVTFISSDMFTEVKKQTFDIIISNPPYLTDAEWQKLTPDVKQWETRLALVAKNKGLAFYKQIAEQAPQLLSKSHQKLPSLVLEIGHSQKKAVTTLLRDNCFETVESYQDLFGCDRWIVAR